MKRIPFMNVSQYPILKYLYFSIIVTILDATIVWILYRVFHYELIAANTIGVVAGFFVHYLLSSKSIFHADLGFSGFAIYLGTFVIGLLLADGLIYIGTYYLFESMQADLSFLLSKGFSVGVPFFFLYYIRKVLFNMLKRKRATNNEKSKGNYHFS